MNRGFTRDGKQLAPSSPHSVASGSCCEERIIRDARVNCARFYRDIDTLYRVAREFKRLNLGRKKAHLFERWLASYRVEGAIGPTKGPVRCAGPSPTTSGPKVAQSGGRIPIRVHGARSAEIKSESAFVLRLYSVANTVLSQTSLFVQHYRQ